MKAIRETATIVLLACTGGCSGGDNCDSSFTSQVLPTGVAARGTQAFVSANWFLRPSNDCREGRIGGAIHIVDLASGTSTTLATVAGMTGASGLNSTEFAVIPGGSRAPSLSVNEYFSVAVGSSSPQVSLQALPSQPLAVLGSGGDLFFLLDGDSVVRRVDSSEDALETVQAGRELAFAKGFLLVSSQASQVAVIDRSTFSEAYRLSSCDSAGPVSFAAPDHVLLQCFTGGMQILSLNSGGAAVPGLAEYHVVGLTGDPGSPRAIVSIEDLGGPPGTTTQVLDIADGLTGVENVGAISGEAVWNSAGAIVAKSPGFPVRVEFPSGAMSLLPGIDPGIGQGPNSRIAPLSSDRVVVAIGTMSFEAFLLVLDSETGELTQPPIELHPPDELPF